MLERIQSDCWDKIINDTEQFSFGNFIENPLLEDNAEIVPKLGISESDLLSVDEWIGVEDIVATIAGDGRVKTKIYY